MVLKLSLANVWTDSVCHQCRFGPYECLLWGGMVMSFIVFLRADLSETILATDWPFLSSLFENKS